MVRFSAAVGAAPLVVDDERPTTEDRQQTSDSSSSDLTSDRLKSDGFSREGTRGGRPELLSVAGATLWREVAVVRIQTGAGEMRPPGEGESTQSWLRFEQVPVIGRDAELSAVTAALERALAGRGGTCLLRGEAGVGKTQLAEAALRTIGTGGQGEGGTERSGDGETGRQGDGTSTRPSRSTSTNAGSASEVLVLRGKATERETPITYEVITSVLRQLRRQRGLLTLERCSESLASYRLPLAALLPEWRTERHDPGVLSDKAFVFEAVTTLLRETLAIQPVCLFLDDAQWMDQNSLELLQYLAEGLAEEPFALLLSVRDEEPNPWLDGLLVELRRVGRFSTWILRRLGREATVALAEAWLEVPQGSLPPELADYLYRETAGNAFYLQEVINGLLEAGLLERRGDGLAWPVSTAASGIAVGTLELPVITGGMLAQVQRRVQRLSTVDRATLEAASVLGEATEVQVLRATLGVAPDALTRSLENLTRRNFLAPEDRLAEAGVRFTHPKMRQAVYHSLSAEERMRWHREAARVLRSLPSSHPTRSGAAIGYHLSMAEEAFEALPFLLETADRLLRSFAIVDAAWYVGRAERHLEQLRLGEPDHWVTRQEGQLWLMRGHLAWGQGRYADSRAAFLRAWECLKDLPTEVDPELKATAAMFQTDLLLGQGERDKAEAWITEQWPLFEEALSGSQSLLYVYYQRARIYGDRKQWAERVTVLREGLEFALAIDSDEHVGICALQLHQEALSRGDNSQSQVLRKLLESRTGAGGTWATLVRSHWCAATEAGRRGEWETAHAKAAAAMALAEQYRHRPFQGISRWLQLQLRALSEPEVALPQLRAEIAAAEAQDARRHGMALAALTAAAAESGAWKEAAAAAEELLSRAGTVVAEPDRPEHHGWPHQALLTLAEAALVHGHPGEALNWLDTIVPDGCPPGEFWSPDEALSLRAWALAEQGEEMARATTAAAQEALAAVPDVRLRAIMQAQLAHAALSLGEVEAARALYEAAQPVLQACNSHARLRALEERLQFKGQGSAVRGQAPVEPSEGKVLPIPSPQSPAAVSSPALRVRLLGGFECAVDDRALMAEDWGSRKARNVFKYLLLRRGRPVPADDILEEFWPDLTIDGARHALRSTLHRIRRALEPDRPARAPSAFLQVADDTVCLQTGPNVAVDLFEFEDRLGQARRREAQGDAAGANQLREEASALYTGDLLPQDVSESWAMGTREWLREQYLSALARLAEAAIARSEPAAALPFAEAMLEADPTHEPGIRALVRSLTALGRGSEAVRRFDLFAQRLDRDLGLIPERETRELVEGLRRSR